MDPYDIDESYNYTFDDCDSFADRSREENMLSELDSWLSSGERLAATSSSAPQETTNTPIVPTDPVVVEETAVYPGCTVVTTHFLLAGSSRYQVRIQYEEYQQVVGLYRSRQDALQAHQISIIQSEEDWGRDERWGDDGYEVLNIVAPKVIVQVEPVKPSKKSRRILFGGING